VNQKKILVIEDNPLNMKLVKVLLGQAGYDVLEATEAETGIQLIREHLPDLVLMDVQLPGMDGLTATRIIKEDPDLAKTRVVALTSFAMTGDEEKARQAGCVGYLTKPINTRTFLSSVTEYFF
jgi:CheY-like chemotaxis protein